MEADITLSCCKQQLLTGSIVIDIDLENSHASKARVLETLTCGDFAVPGTANSHAK